MSKIIQLLIKIKNLLPAILGVVQAALPILKELLVVLGRLLNVIFFWTDWDEKFIAKLNKGYNFINNGFEKLKNFLLGLGWKL
jgi:hypothetical protein